MAYRVAAVFAVLVVSVSAAADSPPPPPAPPQPAVTEPAANTRVFCDQSVTYQIADPASVPDSFRPYIGIFSDADWTPQLCAALIIENVQGDGTATITYVSGPIGSGSRTPGNIQHGTGIVRDGALQFQAADGSQFAFKPFYTDLAGRLTTAQGQTYEAVFKKTY
jgi:hypothetical protein